MPTNSGNLLITFEHVRSKKTVYADIFVEHAYFFVFLNHNLMYLLASKILSVAGF